MKTYSVSSALSGAMADLSHNTVFDKLVGSYNITSVIDSLVKRWKSPSRFYHSIENHLLPMLWDIKIISIDERSRNLLEIIAWFHDCVYNPKSIENELNSIKFFHGQLSDKDCADAGLVREVIGFTRDFKFKGVGDIKDHFADLDLNYLNHTDVGSIVRNELLLLKEFQFVDYSEYKKRRIEILNNLSGSKWTDLSTINQICDYLTNHRPRIGIYPGSFNPFHVGHLSILQEAEKLFDKVIVAIGINPEKQKISGGKGTPAQLEKILPYHQIDRFYTFLHEYVETKYKDADVTIIRGFRSGYDIDYELTNLAFMRDMAKNVKMVFIAPQKKFDHVSSSAIRLIKGFGEKESKRYIPKPYYPLG